MGVNALGRLFDVGSVIQPIDLAAGANTGHRIHMKNAGGVAFICALNNGTAAEAPTFDLQEHDAATSGNSQDLNIVSTFYKKEEAALDGDETWTKVTQAAASEVTDATWDDANELLVVIEVQSEQLSDTFEWVSINVADVGTAHVGAVIGIVYDLKVQRAPENLAQLNA